MDDLVYIDQTLHGYADGHQLLATSIDLSAEQQSVLLIMSDLSGPAFRSGYEAYLTGYPLSGGAFYCLARTWFAPELPRPGCVWTQTLILRAEDLARIRDFDSVAALFLRPTSLSEVGGYCRRLRLDPRSSISRKDLTDIRSILRALYDGASNIVISSETSERYETTLLAIFEQQWPRLRRSFRFCSGALSLRDREFDVSVSPPEVTHSISQTSISIPRSQIDRPADEEWLDVACLDVIERKIGGEYRTFLWRHGPDFLSGREVFRSLTEIYCLLRGSDTQANLEGLFSAIGHYYPAPDVAVRLKSSIFGREKARHGRSESEAHLLKLLVSHPSTSSIPPEISNIRARAHDLAREDLTSASDIAGLASQLGGEQASEFLAGFFENSQWPAEYLELAPTDLLSSLLAKQPNLLDRAPLWRRDDRIDWVTKFFSQIASDDNLLRRSVLSMMEAHAWDALSKLISFSGEPAARTLFLLIDADASEVIDYPDSMFSDLSRHQEVWMSLIHTAQLGPRALKFLSAELDPRSWFVRRVSLKSWSIILGTGFRFNSGSRELRSAVFLLSIGLSSWETDGAPFVASSFSTVYASAGANRIDDALWQQLEPNLSWYSPSWDKCARLVRTVTRAFHERPWSLQEFLLTFKSKHELGRALREFDDSFGGYRFIKNLRKTIQSGSIKASDEQLTVLNSFS
jgi:hypothetical protein